MREQGFTLLETIVSVLIFSLLFFSTTLSYREMALYFSKAKNSFVFVQTLSAGQTLIKAKNGISDIPSTVYFPELGSRLTISCAALGHKELSCQLSAELTKPRQGLRSRESHEFLFRQ